MPPKKRVSRALAAGSKGDDGGCLLLLLFALWFFGFVTFHSRERGKAIARMENVSTELQKAESQLKELSDVLTAMRSETAELTEERREVGRQVARLERVRTELSATLAAADVIVKHSRPGWLEQLRRWLLDSVLGNILAAVLAAPVLWYLKRVLGPLWARLRGRGADGAA